MNPESQPPPAGTAETRRRTKPVGFFDPAGRAAYARDEVRVTIEFTDAARSRWRRRNNEAPECVITTPTH